jgi:Tol biopolymer transport system component
MRSNRSCLLSFLLAGALFLPGLLAPAEAAAQYFGRNKVQYASHDFKVLRTEHFDIYYYEDGAEIVPEAARMAERWYARIARVLDHQLDGRQPLILYTSHPDFEQTNAIFGEIGESTGGVTEVLKRRIVLPLAGPLDQSDHVIGHELVHAFQFDITSVSGEGGIGFRGPTALMLPLWFVEGMAEYLSIGPVDPHTAMWMRDAAADCCELPTTRDLSNPYEYFPYRWGQAFWAFVAGRWGDEAVGKVLKVAGRSGNAEGALEVVLQTSIDEINREWHESIRAAYASVAAGVLDSTAVAPLLERLEPEPEIVPPGPPGERPEREPDEKALQERTDLSRSLITGQHGDARLLFSEARGAGGLNVGPSLSPDGSRVVFLSEKDRLSIEMFLADVDSGRILRRITKNATDPHLESLQFINSAGAWSPDGRMFAFGSVVKGTAAITVIDPDTGARIRELKFPQLGEIFTPTFSPDGRRIAFSGLVGGVMDLFVTDLERGELRRLTNDLYSDLQPAWSPDGGSIAFVTDRFSTDLATLHYGNYRLAVIDPDTGEIQALPVFGKGKHIDPQWSADGQGLYFVTDVSGISNVYRFDFRGGRLSRVTDLITGVSGITALSPVISTAGRADRLVYTAYERGDYNLYVVDGETQLAGVPIEGQIEGVSPAVLPPQDRTPGLITVLLDQPELGLQDTLTFSRAEYSPKLSLDYVSQPVVGAGVDRYGSFFAGGISMFFSDMLGNRNLGATVNVNTAYGDITKSSALIVGYENRRSRWNWFVQGGQIPYVTGGLLGRAIDPETGDLVEVDLLQWQVSRQIAAGVSYPFNRSHRWELSGGYQNLDFSEELRFNYYDPGTLQFLGSDSEDRDAPQSLNQGVLSTALVYDNALYGGTGPILGQRYRLELSPSVGNLNYLGALADYRRYFMPMRPFTLATRLMHYGRYGSDAEALWSEVDAGAPELWANRQVIRDIYLGYPNLIRGYSSGSFSAEECFGSGATVCYPYAQLFGSRIAVANLEFRIPLLGFFGVIPSAGFPPLEIAPFFDAGLAWRSDSENVGFSCGAGETPGLDCREVVTSHGIAARLNLLGFLIMELDFVHPNNRPGRGWYWQFNLLQAF